MTIQDFDSEELKLPLVNPRTFFQQIFNYFMPAFLKPYEFMSYCRKVSTFTPSVLQPTSASPLIFSHLLFQLLLQIPITSDWQGNHQQGELATQKQQWQQPECGSFERIGGEESTSWSIEGMREAEVMAHSGLLYWFTYALSFWQKPLMLHPEGHTPPFEKHSSILSSCSFTDCHTCAQCFTCILLPQLTLLEPIPEKHWAAPNKMKRPSLLFTSLPLGALFFTQHWLRLTDFWFTQIIMR